MYGLHDTQALLSLLMAMSMASPPDSIADTQTRSHRDTVEIVFRPLSNIKLPLSSNLRAFGGDGYAYLAGIQNSPTWLKVDPRSGQVIVLEEPLPLENEPVAIVASENGSLYASTNSTFTVVTNTVTKRRFMPGRIIAATVDNTGAGEFLVVDNGSILLVSGHPDGAITKKVLSANPFDGAEWIALIGSIGSENAYIANLMRPYQITVLPLDTVGSMSVWNREAAWVNSGTDEFGRPLTQILAIHELEELVLVVSATRRSQATGLYGSIAKFIRDNVFVLEIIERDTGRVFASTVSDVPPFFGSITHDIVYGIAEDAVSSSTVVEFWRVESEFTPEGGL